MDTREEKNKPIRFYKSLVFKAGIIVSVALVLSIVVGALHTYHLVRREEEQTALQAAETCRVIMTAELREDTLEYLLDYWEANYEKMHFLRPDAAQDKELLKEWADVHKEVRETYSQFGDALTPADLEEMSEEDRLLMAEHIYTLHGSGNSGDLVGMQLNRDDVAVFVFKYIGDDQAFLWYGSGDVEDDGAMLGRIIPFELSKHPIAARALETGEMPDRAERIVSRSNGKEYLFAAVPLVLDGKVKGLVAVRYPWSETKDNLIERITQIGGRVLLYMAFADVLLLILLYVTVLKPVNRVQRRVRDYSEKKDSSQVEEGLRKTNQKQDEIGSLSRDITDLTKEVDRYVAEIYTLAEEKAAVGAELSVATRIQASMLPSTFPAFPDRTEFDIFASMTPAKEVGGDFYDFFLLDEDHLALVMADVSGKGVPAALFMVVSRTLIKTQAQMSRSPKAILENVNRKLCVGNDEGMFVTVWLGILEISTGKIAAYNAGHEKPAVKAAGGRFELLMDQHTFMLGVMPDIKSDEYEIRLEKGGCLFLYTDGVPEATDADNQMFGTDRMIEALNQDPDASPEVLLSNVKAATDAFVKEAPQFDDLTMLALTYQGGKNG